ncbi:MAG: tetratricopeptide repeat protein [Desulfovibrio sp.]|nr:tetratricopeptide repeat protein [Desulfovibrio sp.]
MPQMLQLFPRVKNPPQIRMGTMGHLLWLCWQKDLPGAINQTLVNYGGMQVYSGEDQALWFFFTEDVFLVLARFIIWGNFNELPVSVELFPGRLLIDRAGGASLDVDASLQSQEIIVPDKLEVWVHPKSCEDRKQMPGIEFAQKRGRQGMAGSNWYTPVVDIRMPFASTQSWFIVLHPIGNPVDKEFMAGWDALSVRLHALLDEHKIKSLIEGSFIMLSIESLFKLRAFMRDWLTAMKDMELAEEGVPCVSVIIDRGSLNFNRDLPEKINLHWDRLVAGFPYVNYRNAYLMGKGFIIRDLHFHGDQMTMDAWCNILLDDRTGGNEVLPLMIAESLTNDKEGKGVDCYFCGMANHSPLECPTRAMPPARTDVWEAAGELDMEVINASFRQIENALLQKGNGEVQKLLSGKDDAAVLMNALAGLVPLCQMRNIPEYWLKRFREPSPGERLPKKDDHISWEVLDTIVHAEADELSGLDQRMENLLEQHPRDARLATLHGFVRVLQGDMEHALKAFREAADYSGDIALQAWNEFLAARALEEMGRFGEAIQQYQKLTRIMQDDVEARYRAIVCRVKMGFAEQMLDTILSLIRERPEYFNHFLLDPGLERGRIHILTYLHCLWEEARSKAEAEIPHIQALRARFDKWFGPDHPVREKFDPKIAELERLSGIQNYMTFLRVFDIRPQLEEELEDYIEQDVEALQDRYSVYLDILQRVRDEASWFPFPAALREFSQTFNQTASIINWAYSSNFRDRDSFSKAEEHLPEIEKLLRRLKKELKTLRLVRDGTLFAMIMGKTFLIIEILGLVISLVAVLSIGYFGDSLHLGWLKAHIGENKVSILKVLSVVVSVLAIGLGALRTTLVFDSRRDKLLEQARTSREKDQEARLARVRAKRREEVEEMRRARREECERERQRQLKERMGTENTGEDPQEDA